MKLLISMILTFASLNVFGDITRRLPKDDSLGKTAKAIGTILADGNIASGTTSLWAGELKKSKWFKNDSEFKVFVLAAFAETFKDERRETLPSDARPTITVGRFVDGDGRSGDVYKMTKALMESNDYNPDNKDLRESQARYLWAVLRALPVSEKTYIGHVKVKLQDESSGEMRSVQYFLLANKDKKAVQFFTIQGFM